MFNSQQLVSKFEDLVINIEDDLMEIESNLLYNRDADPTNCQLKGVCLDFDTTVVNFQDVMSWSCDMVDAWTGSLQDIYTIVWRSVDRNLLHGGITNKKIPKLKFRSGVKLTMMSVPNMRQNLTELFNGVMTDVKEALIPLDNVLFDLPNEGPMPGNRLIETRNVHSDKLKALRCVQRNLRLMCEEWVKTLKSLYNDWMFEIEDYLIKKCSGSQSPSKKPRREMKLLFVMLDTDNWENIIPENYSKWLPLKYDKFPMRSGIVFCRLKNSRVVDYIGLTCNMKQYVTEHAFAHYNDKDFRCYVKRHIGSIVVSYRSYTLFNDAKTHFTFLKKAFKA